ncbi:hypothetical protein SAMN05216391_11193 [Lachnospiraceae bacterium KHCPX20]|jgi:hypothetical protein|nr:hypothetical protein SAMN05216391_11193 [Lachnospiraceae bacterium KHCPX20]
MFVYYLNVPVNSEGVEEFESYSETMPDVKTFELTEEEYLFLRKPNGLFQKFDATFGTIIDVCEEERITFEQLPVALELTEYALKIAKDQHEKSAIEKMRDSLVLAIESETFMEIDIYVE